MRPARCLLPRSFLGLLSVFTLFPAAYGAEPAPGWREIGTPVRSVNWVQARTGIDAEGNECICAVMGQTAKPLFVLHIDPISGAFRQHVAAVSNANFPTAVHMSRSGKLYIGAAYAGRLLCYDPKEETLTDLGRIHAGAASFPCAIDEDAQGRIWIGSYPTADLTCYDPKTGEFHRHGRMDETDMYNYLQVAGDGCVANLIRMTKPHVVMFDPETSEKRTAGPVVTKGKGTVALHEGPDGKLYVVSSEGTFRIDGLDAVKVDGIPNSKPMPAKKPGMTFRFTDAAEQIYRTLAVQMPDGKTYTHTLDYEAAGSRIFCLHAGPDGCVYGSSYLPLHLFRYDPRDDSLVDLGRCSSASGEAYSMANVDGRIVISSYPAANISVYDPAKPYRYGTGSKANPRDFGRIDNISYRPHTTLAGPDGRAWVASTPDYGRWGGPLSWLCPKTGRRHAYYRIAGDASCHSLAYLPKQDLLAVGTSIGGGTGTRPKVDQAVVFLWDRKAEKKVWEGTFEDQVTSINMLLTTPDGHLVGTFLGSKSGLFFFNPESREFEKTLALPGGRPLDNGLQIGRDGNIYGVTSRCVYRVDPAKDEIETVVKTDDPITVAGPIVGKEMFVGRRHRLWGVVVGE